MRCMLAAIPLGLGLAAAAADYTSYQRSTDNAKRLEINTRINIERIQGELAATLRSTFTAARQALKDRKRRT